jgi:thiaminase
MIINDFDTKCIEKKFPLITEEHARVLLEESGYSKGDVTEGIIRIWRRNGFITKTKLEIARDSYTEFMKSFKNATTSLETLSAFTSLKISYEEAIKELVDEYVPNLVGNNWHEENKEN